MTVARVIMGLVYQFSLLWGESKRARLPPRELLGNEFAVLAMRFLWKK